MTELLAWYERTYTPQKASQKAEKSRLRLLSQPPIGDQTLRTLTSHKVMEFILLRKAQKVTPDTIRKDLGTLSQALQSYCNLSHIDIPHGNVVTKARKSLVQTATLSPGPSRTRRLKPGEEALLRGTMNERMNLVMNGTMGRFASISFPARARPSTLEPNVLSRPGGLGR